MLLTGTLVTLPCRGFLPKEGAMWVDGAVLGPAPQKAAPRRAAGNEGAHATWPGVRRPSPTRKNKEGIRAVFCYFSIRIA